MFIIDDIIIGAYALSGTAAATVTMMTGAALITAGTTYYQRQTAKSAASQQKKEQEAAAKAQAEFAGQQRAIAGLPLSADQMKMVMNQREIENLVRKFDEQDQTEIYTLPAMEPTSPIERINRAIDDLFSK